jgi:hypothetical protein
MSNQKTTQLRRILSTEVVPGDLIPIVDVSEITSPTGETKHIRTVDFASYVVSGGFTEVNYQYQSWQSANGLSFSEVVPASDNERCYGRIRNLGTDYSIVVRAYVPSDCGLYGANRVLFGVGQNTQIAEVGSSAYSAYIGISNADLIAWVEDGSSNYVPLTYAGFFGLYPERVFSAALTKNSSGLVSFYVNGILWASGSGATWSTANTHVVLGHGRSSMENIKTTIYEGHIYQSCLSGDDIRNMFYRGIDTTDATLIASYNGSNLNAGPTQWLDSVGSNHLSIPTVGAKATNPGKRFILSFPVDGTSQYLGSDPINGRDVLPARYIITSCLVESSGKPLLSIGSTNAVAPVSASGTGSWNNNRVALVSASYGVNPVNLLSMGVAHTDKSIYVYYSASAAPCTFSFDGYIRN